MAPVVLILGAGKNIGAGVAAHFSAAGYSVAVVTRSFPTPSPSTDPETGHLRIRADLSDAAQVRDTFAQARKHFGRAPRVVVYNAAALTPPPDAENLFSLPVEQVEADLKLMNSGAWVAAGEAVKGWAEDGEEGKRGRFIYTGNLLNEMTLPVPALVTLGVGKNAAWSWVSLADAVYKDKKGWRFFYADERKADGSSIGNVPDAESNGKFYLELAEGAKDLPSTVTFVDGKYQKF
ncbi:short-chain dehydrogenase/reductase SDR [Colletotrichum tofieldiae]|uniref:Short-chain dehydrogenase/reductase SDR n=1 Tax=Colletotrichum tofieldiae TaxID=708197 RepID=A0A166XTG6_9PEZI|nr:short-chain dehydrogenase/reductase SDR [Colletotrichum tofieldiae]GKT60523.1 short-chain dehydrogenase/reductase SDR [Colletotrichum tofieldiae]GKT68228.1 short-chain dehydrogenase/reductase SDR [Colletotrichum tofieldiae]GKT90767.1 short-chain dehydrogenase/reductase SDR [Colletotrichum tofieldiae]